MMPGSTSLSPSKLVENLKRKQTFNSHQQHALDVVRALLTKKSQEETLDDFMDYIAQRYPHIEFYLFAFHTEDEVHLTRSRPVVTGQIRDAVFPPMTSDMLCGFDNVDMNDLWCLHYQPYLPHIERLFALTLEVGNRHFSILVCEGSAPISESDVQDILFGTETVKASLNYVVSIEKMYEHFEHIEHTQKLASLGRLAAGVAHEINNPLAYVMSNMSSLNASVKQLKASVPSEKAVSKEWQQFLQDSEEISEESVQGLMRIQNIVASLNVYNHSENPKLSLVDLRDVITTSLTMIMGELRYNAEVDYQEPDEPFYVLGQATKLQQVFIHLFMNAFQAMESGKGILTIRLSREMGALAPRKHNIHVAVNDNGHGINQEHLDKVFDPFFTTRQVGSGAGLGLSVAKEIIHDHDGKIAVESETGEGTRVDIRLPCVIGMV